MDFVDIQRLGQRLDVQGERRGGISQFRQEVTKLDRPNLGMWEGITVILQLLMCRVYISLKVLYFETVNVVRSLKVMTLWNNQGRYAL